MLVEQEQTYNRPMPVTQRRRIDTKAAIAGATKATELRPPVKQPTAQPLEFLVLDQIAPQDSRYLWYPYIPADRLTIIEGDPGVGKSWITCSIAAAISSGTRLPQMNVTLPAQRVLMASTEDGMAETVVPRLLQLGADMKNIALIPHTFTLDKEGVARLEATVKGFSATLIFIDPLVAYIGGKVDMYRANEVRDVMQRLAAMAERTQSAVVVVRHLRKEGNKKGKDIYAGMGSIDFTAAARSVVSVSKMRGGDRVFKHIKANNSPEGKPLQYDLNYEAEPIQHVDTARGVLVVETKWDKANFQWLGVYDKKLVPETREPNTKPRKFDEAVDFLRAALLPGPQRASDLMVQARVLGISEKTLLRARRLTAETYKASGVWMWRSIDPGKGKDYIPTSEGVYARDMDKKTREVKKVPRRKPRKPLDPALEKMIDDYKASA